MIWLLLSAIVVAWVVSRVVFARKKPPANYSTSDMSVFTADQSIHQHTHHHH